MQAIAVLFFLVSSISFHSCLLCSLVASPIVGRPPGAAMAAISDFRAKQKQYITSYGTKTMPFFL